MTTAENDLLQLEIRLLKELHLAEIRINQHVDNRIDSLRNILIPMIIGAYALNISSTLAIILFVVNHK